MEYSVTGITVAAYLKSKGATLLRTEKIAPTVARFIFRESSPGGLAKLEGEFYQSACYPFYRELGNLRREIDAALGHARNDRGR